MEDMLQAGIVANTHGVRGELKIYPTTDDVRRFSKLKEAYIDTEKEKILIHILSVKYHKNMAIIKTKEINDMDEAMKYKGCPLLVERKNAVKLEKGEYFKQYMDDIKKQFKDF